MSNMNKNIKYFISIFLGIFLIIYFLQSNPALRTAEEPEVLTFSQFKQMLTEEGQDTVGKIYSSDQEIRESFSIKTPFILNISPRAIEGRYLKPGVVIEPGDDLEKLLAKSKPFTVESNPDAVTESIQNQLDLNGIIYKFSNPETNAFYSIFMTILPVLLVGMVFWFFMMRQIQGTGNRALAFGKSKARLSPEGSKKVNFNDVAGCDEAKEELVEVVDFLKDPRKFNAIGAKIPKGVLLVGPPGTGKTLLARAVSGEAGVPFFSISGSDFVEMFVGVGASRVRDLFEQAKRSAPCIIFIDEIDAVGRLRGAGLGGGHDEREQTLNQMLVEMDGFEENEGIIIMAATNRPDVLDPALLRPGRFDRQVVVDSPDVKGREAILKIHAKKVPLSSDVNLTNIARGTPGFTGADLANLINEGALLAARRNKKRVYQEDLEDAKDKVMMGPERRSFLISPSEKRITAYHEAGHAILGALLPKAEPVHKVTIIPRGRALGLTMFLPQEDKHTHPRSYWQDRICVGMGGFIAEEQIIGDTSTGASGDIQTVTAIARRMVTEWGMSEILGTISYSNNDQSVFLGRELGTAKNYSDETAHTIDMEVKRIIQEQLDRGRDLLHQHAGQLEEIATSLLERETIDGEVVYRSLGLNPPTPPNHDMDKPANPGTEEKDSHDSHSGEPGLDGNPTPAPAV